MTRRGVKQRGGNPNALACLVFKRKRERKRTKTHAHKTALFGPIYPHLFTTKKHSVKITSTRCNGAAQDARADLPSISSTHQPAPRPKHPPHLQTAPQTKLQTPSQRNSHTSTKPARPIAFIYVFMLAGRLASWKSISKATIVHKKC